MILHIMQNNIYDDTSSFEELVRSFTIDGDANELTDLRDAGLSHCLSQYIQSRYGSMKRFQNPHNLIDINVVNGFTRIDKLRKALGALDRSGWDRSYHQRIFHVIILAPFYYSYPVYTTDFDFFHRSPFSMQWFGFYSRQTQLVSLSVPTPCY
jgi:hypothetical protein